MDAASSHMVKLPETQEIPGLKPAADEIKEGIKALLIRLADRSKLGWAVVDAYESDELASDDKDAKRIKEAKRTADQKEQKEKRKRQAALQRGGRSSGNGWCGQPQPYVNTPVAPGAYGGPMPPVTNGVVRPRQVGPCFNCLEIGHLKAQCPKRNRTYPLNQLVNSCVINSVECVHGISGDDHSGVSTGGMGHSPAVLGAMLMHV